MNILFHKVRAFTVLLFLIIPASDIFAQLIRIEKVSISTRNNDEISPVFFKNGIVFCSNRRTNSLLGYANEDSRLFKLFYSAEISEVRWSSPVLFSDEITTTFNEGPATFNSEGTLIYFTRNNNTSGRFSNVNDSANKLGIYSAELVDGRWQNIQPFAYNDPLYMFATPSLAHDGQRLYFSSDMPGGYGGMDIYYCAKCNGGWCKPVNLGPEINTEGNETYPFIDRGGKLWFASDGWPGLGGKDIYYTFEENGAWKKPFSMDSLINSNGDDYGIIVDSNGLSGYFTSDRLASGDIFRFTTHLPEYTECDTFREPSYCFTIYDERYVPNDTLVLRYEWNFGNGVIKTGPQVIYCFPGPGDYRILLDITDEITGDTVAWQVEYDVKLDPPSQLFINAPNISVADKKIAFDTYGSLLEGSEIRDYSWDFGEGFKSGISVMEQRFRYPGKYTVIAGMKNEYDTGCISKEIRILENAREIWRMENNNHILVTLLTDKEIPDAVISAFENAGDVSELTIDKQGIHAETFKWLENIVSALKGTRLHLDIQVYNRDSKPKSIQDSRELSYFLKNHCEPDEFDVHVADIRQLLSEDFSSATCVYEFILSEK